MNIKFIAILCCLIFLCSLSAQNSVIHPAIQVVKAKEISRPEKVALFKPIADRSSEVLSVLQSYTLMSLDNEALGKLTNQKAPFIELSIPTPNQKDIEVELVEVHPFSPDFKVRIAPSMEEVQVGQGEYYRGIVKGEEGSIVALSIVDGEVAGLISSPSLSGNMVIGKLKQSDNYVIYEDHQINGKSNFNCLTADYQIAYTPEELRGISSGSRKENDCIRIYFEVDYDIYVDKGKNVENVSSFVTAIFNQVSMLYAAEDINIVLSEVVVWTQQSPYTATTASGMLNQFTGYRQGFNGDLAQLLSYKIGGGIAYIDGLCKSNPDYSMSYAGIYNSFQNVPTYSWTIEVVTHELGHLFGSQHTHACVWNGNKTAIDGCYNIEGSCPNPGIPSPQQGGTIMSYCHLTNAGIKFSNGFGLQPGNVIRSKVAAASCLTSCLPDGGGTECELNKVILEINTDNYPSETTWDIKNQQGQILYSGGPYYSPRSLSTIELCLPTSCFIFTIYDLYQDGMCCSYGNGSYKIKFEGNTLISGGQFGASESKQFCISSQPAPTCTDGKKNGLETGIDCGGPNCPPCPTCHDGIKNGQETGIDCGGPDCEPCATCTDGKKNGLETGIDCGGPNCPPCPTCHDGIKNGLETGIDCGGPDCEPCATCTDGKKNGLETGIDCGGPNCPPCPTCHDGIKNGLETGIDCGGPDCEPCKPVHMGEVTETFIAGYYFEQGWDNWTDGGDFCSRVRSISSPEGRYSIRLRNNNGEHSSMTSESLMIDEYDSLQVEFSFRALRFGDGDQFKLKYFDGTQWQTARTFIYDQDFINNDQYQKKVHIRFKNISATRIKFEADAQQPTNQIYIDAVVLTGFKTILIDSGSCEDGMLNGMETGIDCGGPNCPPCPTCDDGIQNGYEIGIDCGGPDCLPCITPPEDFEYGAYFETGWDGWLDGGKDCSRYYGNPSPEGAYSIKIRGNSSEQSSMTSQPFDLSMYETVTFQFMFIATGMNNREGFVFQYHDGTSWKKLVHFKAGLHFVNNQTYRVTYTTSSKANDATRFRFQSAGSGEGAMVFIDAVVINVSTATSLVEHPLIIEEVGVPLTDLKISNVPRVFPNPATDILQIKSGEAIHRINIYNPTGQLLKTYNGETNEWLDISELMPGMYILRIETSDDIFVEKILKQ
ncbi:MAG: zinc-dependent metalloprotease [Saprospiraceae bacterium]|nr:zinc-dependent metalloprotease [Saprospiraceae bacterium]